MSIPLDPIQAYVFNSFHRETGSNHHPGRTRIQIRIAGNYMAQELVAPVECRTKGVSAGEILLEAAFDLSYDIAHWLECAAHFFHVRLIHDEHHMLWSVNKCLDLRRYALMPGEPDDQGYEEIYEPLKSI